MLKGFALKRCAILADPRDEASERKIRTAEEQLTEALLKRGVAVDSLVGASISEIQPHQDVQLFLVLGGDGTMIYFAGPLSHLDIPFYGINYGHLGFMMNTLENDLDYHAARLKSGDFMIWSFPLLELEARDLHDQAHCGFGLNDIYMQRMTPQSCKLNISFSGEGLCFNPIICDGVIISTPLGSTAYSYNITGTVVAINTPVMIVTPVAASRTCPATNMVLPLDTTIEIDVLEPVKRRVLMVSDGQSHGDLTHARVRRSRQEVKLCFGSSYGEALPMRFLNKAAG